MGVFAVFRRKKKDVVEVSPEETGAVVASEGDEVTEAKSKAGTETETEAAEIRAGIDADADAGTDVEEGVDGGAGAGAGVDADARVDVDVDADLDAVDKAEAASEVVEIPKQQSAEAAADNEAGEGARK
ncbi:hypothetical protein R1T08_32770 [Streptomyces sp. SBC-4]|nr:hypothetical protein [Streptomyces sp. SBC-4]MDV5148800.1 hypothetical protein [Streptomyces sp. SBC-4]